MSTLGDILGAVKTTVQGLSLAGINSSNIVIKKFPWNMDGAGLPGVVICPVPEQFPLTGSNSQDDTVYSVQVSAIRVGNRALPLETNDALLSWRDSIAKAFREKRITGITGSYRTTVDPGPVIDPAAFSLQLDATTLFIRCQVREERT